jgi:hypothetical protein
MGSSLHNGESRPGRTVIFKLNIRRWFVAIETRNAVFPFRRKVRALAILVPATIALLLLTPLQIALYPGHRMLRRARNYWLW